VYLFSICHSPASLCNVTYARTLPLLPLIRVIVACAHGVLHRQLGRPICVPTMPTSVLSFRKGNRSSSRKYSRRDRVRCRDRESRRRRLIATREEKKKKEGRNTISEIQSIAKRDASSDAVIGGVKIHADDTDDTNARKYVKEAPSKSPR